MNAVRSLTFFVIMAIFFASCVTSWEGLDPTKDAQSIDIMSLNIHYYVPGNDSTNWDARRYAVSESILALDPDIILFQEMETFRWEDWESAEEGGGDAPLDNIQLDWVMETVPGYTPAAIGDSREFPITQPILYRSSRFDLLEQGFFFFSDSPDEIYSTPWSNQWPSFTTWVRLYDRMESREFLVVNTHLNAFSWIDKAKGVELILQRTKDIGTANISAAVQPVVIGGDFNMLAPDNRIRKIREEGFQIITSNGSSFHFGAGVHLYSSIDHFFASEHWNVIDGGVLQKQWAGTWPSDHHPIITRLRLQ